MRIKRGLLVLLGGVVAILSLPMLAAFEAHVVNVTARIENALSVPLDPIHFGTVFPQEELDRLLNVRLSQSFVDEDRVDDVDYVIRQKPKCANDPDNPTEFSQVFEDEEGTFHCRGREHQFLPLLCPYLSKHEITRDGQGENDSDGINSFHGLPGPWTLATTLATQVKGHLAKLQNDLDDIWNIDLKVPCFGDHCAQDWESFVLGINASSTPADYIQPIENEHKVFGCDLWLEVGGISLPGIGCNEELDLMLVLDRSLSISDTELATLKTAAHAFVDALVPDGGPHIGQASFAPSATLDLHLTGNETDIDNAIDALSTAGGFSTNLEDGILTASGELDDLDPHERPAVPDFMVVITDGSPNTCNTGGCDPFDAAEAAADAADAAGTTIFVVGVGTSTSTAAFLEGSIATSPAHYFDAVDFDDLSAILEGIAQCNG